MPTVIECSWCQHPIAAEDRHCGQCGRPVLARAAKIYRTGSRFVLGQVGEDEVAIWDLARPPWPALVEPADQINRLTWTFNYWESQAAADIARRSRHGVAPTAVLAIVVGVFVLLMGASYIYVHAHRYHECLFQPGIFSWPSACL